MRRLLTVALAALVVMPLIPAPTAALPGGTRVETFKGNLEFPIDMAWVAGTRKLFFTEKDGKIRVIFQRRLLARPCRVLPTNSEGERGVLGIALHPRFKKNHLLYVYWTKAEPLENRVTRFRVRDNRCVDATPIVTGIPTLGVNNHNGGQLEFVDGKLFVSTGEAEDRAAAQDTSSRLGKILRYNPNGSVPEGNPFGRHNPVWSYGHRNPFGLTHKPGTSLIYSTENGPECDDELNHILRGRNYGWGEAYQCGTAGVGLNPKPPIFRWETVIVPTDPLWYSGRMKSLSGSIYVGDFSGGMLRRYRMNDSGTAVTGTSNVWDAGEGITSVDKGPGGWLYIVTGSAIKRIVPD